MWDREAALLATSYTTAVYRAGGVALMLPIPPADAVAAGAAEDALTGVDALVLAGGADVDPERYGQQPHPPVRTRPERDEWELRLLRAALERDLPILAICRGVQVLNVVFGGSLHQHLPEVVGHERHQPGPATFGSSEATLVPGSLAARILGERVTVPCYHHQSLADVAPQLDVSGYAEDGTVEAVEHSGHRFVLGVQWHPEENVDDVRLFAALAAEASKQPVQLQGGRQ